MNSFIQIYVEVEFSQLLSCVVFFAIALVKSRYSGVQKYGVNFSIQSISGTICFPVGWTLFYGEILLIICQLTAGLSPIFFSPKSILE